LQQFKKKRIQRKKGPITIRPDIVLVFVIICFLLAAKGDVISDFGVQNNIWLGEKHNLCKGVSMIRVDFDPISETVYTDIILNTIIERSYVFPRARYCFAHQNQI
jgi:hypothetical protein